MVSSLIRSKLVITRALDRHTVEIVEGGAVYQRDGVIVEIGDAGDLAARYPVDEVLGSPHHVVMPGFVNSHHHVGLTPLQLGAVDDALETWWISRLGKRKVDLYLDTLYSAFELVESGVTTVQHLHNRLGGTVEQMAAAANRVIDAYGAVGMRVSYSHSVRDQNRISYMADEEYIARLPDDVGALLGPVLRAQSIPLEDNIALFEALHDQHRNSERVRVQLAPSNLHWCSDKALELVRDCALRHQVPMHMHLLETVYQKEYAKQRSGGSPLRYLHDLGMLGPLMTIGHGVWFTEADIELAAETGTMICHNASSNLRLRDGIAPLNAFEAGGVKVAIGIDEAGINDDRDMLQEMRLVLNLHREPGMHDRVPTAGQVLRMATEHGAQTTPFGASIGTLEPGKAADMVLFDWRTIAYPYLDEEVPVLEAVLRRARSRDVDTVIVAGEPILRDGRFTRIDKQAVLHELASALAVPRDGDEQAQLDLARRLKPHAASFYDADPQHGCSCCRPFYHMNARQ
jgi:cytosine/adenosine deaminase-related metal-dependent hydrolase